MHIAAKIKRKLGHNINSIDVSELKILKVIFHFSLERKITIATLKKSLFLILYQKQKQKHFKPVREKILC